MDSKLESLIVSNISLMHMLLNKQQSRFNTTQEFEDYKEGFMPRYIYTCKMYDENTGYKLSALLTKSVEWYNMNYFTKRSRRYGKYYEVSLDAKVNDDDSDLHSVISDNSDKYLSCVIDEIFEYVTNKYSESESGIVFDSL